MDEKRKEMLVTTTDNPFDPFEQFNDWINYDVNKGYYTCERLARIATTSDSLSDAENDEAIEDAVDELIKYGAISKDGTRVEYKKVYKQN